jgi:prepilin-type N-terminal cleavage/methylation domain-containing protein
MAKIQTQGFTLAELLVSLLILAEIATFTIPKILTSSQSTQSNAITKEAAAMMTAAFQQAQLSGSITASTKPSDLTPYLNSVSFDTSGASIDALPGYASDTCTIGHPCLRLHSGAAVWLSDNNTFGGTANNYALQFAIDPDGQLKGTTSDGPSKAIKFVLYYNGRLSTVGTADATTCNSSVCPFGAPAATNDPSWFHW